MNLTKDKVHLFDMPWTEDADYEHIYEERLHDAMIPFFSFKNTTFSKVVDFESSYRPTASVYAQFISEASQMKFMLKFSDQINELDYKRNW